MRKIDADALIEFIENRYNITWKNDYEGGIKDACTDILEKISKMPTIEPERKKGKWQITDAYPHNVYCSECHTRFAQTHWAVWEDGSLPRNFCPNCGSYNGGENDDKGE